MVHEAKENKILNWLVRYDSNLILMHHRFPTSTINVKRAAHPFSTKDYFGDTQYVLVHNGVIRNPSELKKQHEELGIEYYSVLQDGTFNDSESLLWDFALYMEGKQTELKVAGGIAFICLKIEKGKLTKMYFGRNNSPLNMLRTKTGISLASEGEGEAIDSNRLYAWNYKARRLTSKRLLIPSYIYTKPSSSTSKNSGFSDGYWNNWNNSGGYTPGSYAAGRSLGAGIDNSQFDWEDDDDYRDGGGRWHSVAEKDAPRYGDDGYKAHEDRTMGNILSRQFAHMFKDEDEKPLAAQDKAAQGAVIEYSQDPISMMYLPIGSERLAKSREEFLRKKQMLPSDDEIQTEYMSYLAGERGHFEAVYWTLEEDYADVENMAATADNIRRLVVIEKVSKLLTEDPEYTSDSSISNVWEKLWQNQ